MTEPMCFRNKYITPNLDPYSVCLGCQYRTKCTTVSLDEPGFEYVHPEIKPGTVLDYKTVLLAFRDWWTAYIDEYKHEPDTQSVMLVLASLSDFPEGFIEVQKRKKILNNLRKEGE